MSFRTPRLTQASTLRTESPLHDLAAIIRSRTPLIAVESNEEPQIVSLLREIARKLELKAYRWTVTEGMQAFDPADQPAHAVLKSQEILSYIKNFGANCLFVLLDFRPYLDDNVHVRFLKDIALTYPRNCGPSRRAFGSRCPPRMNCAASSATSPANGARSTASGRFRPPTKRSTCWCATWPALPRPMPGALP